MGLDPTTIGRYVVLGTLGQGAMGTVYLAEDPVLKRGLALKVVNPGHIGREEALLRFRREAEISAKLNHPNVITIFDVGDEPGFGPFLAMEFIEGQPLDELLRKGPLDPAQAMEILLQAAEALGAAHAAGVVHRDVKPANLMVAQDGRVKLMDFGIAREDEKGRTTAALMCTPGYAAPEMLEGARANEASDRWAFAVTAFECVGGGMPFAGESISVVLYNVAHGEAVFPATFSPALRAVFSRALAKDPAARFPSLRALLSALMEALPLEEVDRKRFRSFLGAEVEKALEPCEPAAVPVPKASDPPSPWPSRALPIVGPGGALLLLLLGYLGWTTGWIGGRSLRVDSMPSGAWILVEGRRVGRTPETALRVRARTKEIRLELDGFHPLTHRLGPEDQALLFRLEPTHFTVPLGSDPKGAEVYLDGVKVGETPIESLRIPTRSEHSLLVRKRGRESWAGMVSEGHGPPEHLVLKPEKGAVH
jgi:predicted Ser/Thr protein kinase